MSKLPSVPGEQLAAAIEAAASLSKIIDHSAFAEQLTKLALGPNLSKLLAAESAVGGLAAMAQGPNFSKLLGVSSEAQRAAFAKILPTFDFSTLLGISDSHRAALDALKPSWDFSKVLGVQPESLKSIASMGRGIDASRWLPVYEFNQAAHASARLAQQFEAISKSPAFAGVLDDFNRVRPIVATYEAALAVAPDATSRRLTFEEAVGGVLEVVADFNLGAATPKEIFKNYIAVLAVLWSLWWTYVSWQAGAQQAREINEQRRVQREQATAITTLTEAVSQLQAHVSKGEALPVLHVTVRGILRAGPDGSTARVSRLEVGRKLKVLARYKRWYYVEILTDENRGTDVRGWAYQRNVNPQE